MKNIKSYIFLSLLSLVLCVSCKKNETYITEKDPASDYSLGFTLTLPDQVVVDTKGDEDNTISDVYVVVFDGNTSTANVVDAGEAFVVGGTYYVKLNESTVGGYVYVFANIAREMESIGGAVGATTIEQMQKLLLVKLQQKNGTIIADPYISPMSSELLDYSGGFNATNNNINNVILKRATAKVTVVDKSNQLGVFNLLGSNIGNAPTLGYVVENIGDIKSPNIAHYAGLLYGTSYSIDAMMRDAKFNDVTGYTTTEPLYVFESKKENKTFVIIKSEFNGAVGYHRLNLWDRNTQAFFDINRNYHYIININKIGTAGYQTAQEAIDAQPSNRDINYDIVITDPYSHDIVTNGEQYLSVSNSELRIHQSGDVNDVVATVLSYTVPASGQNNWRTGVVTAKMNRAFYCGGNRESTFAAACRD